MEVNDPGSAEVQKKSEADLTTIVEKVELTKNQIADLMR